MDSMRLMRVTNNGDTTAYLDIRDDESVTFAAELESGEHVDVWLRDDERISGVTDDGPALDLDQEPIGERQVQR
jgi:hypothetical protein